MITFRVDARWRLIVVLSKPSYVIYVSTFLQLSAYLPKMSMVQHQLQRQNDVAASEQISDRPFV